VVILVAGLLFIVVCGKALADYLRRRDPLQRDVVVLLAAPAMLFALSMLQAVTAAPPRPVTAAALILLFGQPFFTLRLLGHVGRVPRWLYPVVVGGWVMTAVPLALLSRPVAQPVVWAAVGAFFAGQLIAALYLVGEAQRRAGAARVRLGLAAAATAAFGAMLLIAATGPQGSRAARPGLAAPPVVRAGIGRADPAAVGRAVRRAAANDLAAIHGNGPGAGRRGRGHGAATRCRRATARGRRCRG
jgi:hypothetical protein